MTIPKRSPNTMIDAISLSSPSGRMSKRARRSAEKRLHDALFGANNEVFRELEPTVEEQRKTRATKLLRTAKNLRDLATRGMSTRAYLRKATELEEEAESLYEG